MEVVIQVVALILAIRIIKKWITPLLRVVVVALSLLWLFFFTRRFRNVIDDIFTSLSQPHISIKKIRDSIYSHDTMLRSGREVIGRIVIELHSNLSQHFNGLPSELIEAYHETILKSLQLFENLLISVLLFGSTNIFRTLYPPAEDIENIKANEIQISLYKEYIKLPKFELDVAKQRAALLENILVNSTDEQIELQALIKSELATANYDLVRQFGVTGLLLPFIPISPDGNWLRYISSYANLYIVSDRVTPQHVAIKNIIKKSLELYTEALEIYRKLDNKLKEAECLDLMSDCYLDLSYYENDETMALKAGFLLGKALSILENIPTDQTFVAIPMVSKIIGSRDVGNYLDNVTLTDAYHALEKIDRIRGQNGSFLERYILNSYNNIIAKPGLKSLVYSYNIIKESELNPTLHKTFFYFLDCMEESRTITNIVSLSELDIASESIKLSEKIIVAKARNTLINLISTNLESQIKTFDHKLTEHYVNLRSYWQNVLKEYEYAQLYWSIRQDSNMELHELPKLASKLYKNTGFFYLKQLDNQHILCCLVTLNPIRIQHHVVPISATELEKRYFEEYRREVLSPNGSTALGGWRNLGKKIFPPFIHYINSLEILYIIADSKFERFAVHALWVNDVQTYLIDLCPVAYISSIRLLRQLAFRDKTIETTKQHHVIAYNKLRSKLGIEEIDEREYAESVSELAENQYFVIGYERPKLSSKDSIEETILIQGNAYTAARGLGIKEPMLQKLASHSSLRLMNNAKIIHIACHGSEDPHKPGLLLYDGLFDINDILKLKLKADLVFLSVCLSRQPDTNRVIENITKRINLDVTDAFICSGANSVISALWRIPADTTQKFVECFYDELHKVEHTDHIETLFGEREGYHVWKQTTYAKALQKAMLQIKEIDPNPKNWAGMIFTGFDY